jgi:NTP pyrophosphatase (non-canonical NTP hydrolase)
MTSDLTFRRLSIVNAARCDKWQMGKDWSIAEWTNSLSGEAGEAGNVAKKLIRIRDGMIGNGDMSKEELEKKLEHEIADVVIYADLISYKLNFDLGKAVQTKFNKKSEELGFEEKL